MSIICILPILETIHEFIKFVKSDDVFVCDFVKIMKMCCANLYSFLLWSQKKYIDLKFKNFLDLVDAQMMGCW
jgi:hypothetical protein